MESDTGSILNFQVISSVWELLASKFERMRRKSRGRNMKIVGVLTKSPAMCWRVRVDSEWGIHSILQVAKSYWVHNSRVGLIDLNGVFILPQTNRYNFTSNTATWLHVEETQHDDFHCNVVNKYIWSQYGKHVLNAHWFSLWNLRFGPSQFVC